MDDVHMNEMMRRLASRMDHVAVDAEALSPQARAAELAIDADVALAGLEASVQSMGGGQWSSNPSGDFLWLPGDVADSDSFSLSASGSAHFLGKRIWLTASGNKVTLHESGAVSGSLSVAASGEAHVLGKHIWLTAGGNKVVLHESGSASAGNLNIQVQGTSGSAFLVGSNTGTVQVLKFASATDSNVKVTVAKSGNTVTATIGVYYV